MVKTLGLATLPSRGLATKSGGRVFLAADLVESRG